MLSEVVSFLRSMNRYWQTVRESWQISGLEEMAKHAVREGVGGGGVKVFLVLLYFRDSRKLQQ